MFNNFTTIFDYTYYRLAKAYYRWDGNSGITAYIGLSLIQSIFVLDLFGFFGITFFSAEERKPNLIYVQAAYIILFLGITCFNYFRYKHTYYKFHQKWKDEDKMQRRIKGFAIVVSFIVIVSFIGIILNVKDYTK